MRISSLETPCLVLDESKLNKNIERMESKFRGNDIVFRPHMKTAKCMEVATRMMPNGRGPITVSTLLEARQFAEAGVNDILYAVGIAPSKLEAVAAIRSRGVDLSVIVDSVEQAKAVARKARLESDSIPTLVEVDVDGYRGGVHFEKIDEILSICSALDSGGAEMRGILTHSGATYGCRDIHEIKRIAEWERQAAVQCATQLRLAGVPCRTVSIGSTPAVHFADDFTGVTEIRAGVFAFFDLIMAGLKVCELDDIALSVLTTVIGHQRDEARLIVDAGWMAMSRDLGTANQHVDQRYGVVCTVDGEVIPNLIMADTSQEHGILALRPGSDAAMPDLPIGAMVRILPVHACATAAQHHCYHVVSTRSQEVSGVWQRFSGW